jgi:hypothetical protein
MVSPNSNNQKQRFGAEDSLLYHAALPVAKLGKIGQPPGLMSPRPERRGWNRTFCPPSRAQDCLRCLFLARAGGVSAFCQPRRSGRGNIRQEVYQKRDKSSNEPRGWQKIVGVFADNPDFEDAVRLGRDYRESQGPPE